MPSSDEYNQGRQPVVRWKTLLLISLLFVILSVTLPALLHTLPRELVRSGTVFSVTVWTPVVPAPRGEVVATLDIPAYVPAGAVHVCAGNGISFRNRHTDRIVITASDYSFSSGVIPPGGEFTASFPAPGTVSVQVAIPGNTSALTAYRVEVEQCEAR